LATGEAPALEKPHAPPGFYFDPLDRSIDWDRIRSSCPTSIAKNRSISQLLLHLNDIAYGDIRGCDDYQPVPSAVVKAVEMAQLTTQYLLFCQSLLRQQRQSFQDGLKAKEREATRVRREMGNARELAHRLQDEIRRQDHLLRSYRGVLKSCRLPKLNGHRGVAEYCESHSFDGEGDDSSRSDEDDESDHSNRDTPAQRGDDGNTTTLPQEEAMPETNTTSPPQQEQVNNVAFMVRDTAGEGEKVSVSQHCDNWSGERDDASRKEYLIEPPPQPEERFDSPPPQSSEQQEEEHQLEIVDL